MNFLKSKDREIFVVGGQAHNSSFYDVKIDEACLAVKKIGGNTIELPVYWENIEPQEGQFDFREVQEAYKKMVCTLFFCGLEPGKTEPANLFRYG